MRLPPQQHLNQHLIAERHSIGVSELPSAGATVNQPGIDLIRPATHQSLVGITPQTIERHTFPAPQSHEQQVIDGDRRPWLWRLRGRQRLCLSSKG